MPMRATWAEPGADRGAGQHRRQGENGQRQQAADAEQ